ncbi:hypothetical protein N7495_009061 [Penicillium taxi]|uniref:uncharacterized protein n=1 Tax=Penicillium taxi TaxID=168475 RepID=UPI002544ED4C|nr:uncharacterized protein N7495_009061 [Penicillium taxi]KAJ5889020.1 hypothetical protein N7495_009061 [Penicillium taxi]
MSEQEDPLNQAEAGHLTKFSKLEASLVHTEVEKRPNSRAQNDVNRYAEASDLSVNELAFDFNLDRGHYPLDNLKSLQQVFNAVQCHEHLEKRDNFSPETRVECLKVSSLGGEWLILDEAQMGELLRVQGAPLSVYMRYDTTRNLTTYVISHKELDTSIVTLKSLLKIALNTTSAADRPAVFLDDPFEIHIILSTLSFEASKFHVKRFRRFMWAQINKVDDQLEGLEAEDRAKLKYLTKQLQIISQNTDSHLGNADVCIITATAIRNVHSRFVSSISREQKIWFLNYKQRKDSTMSLVYNLMTQQDATNNIRISNSMKQDSAPMNAIAVLTMAFLPGTFAATVVRAGVFGGTITGAGVWWVWISIIVPVTTAVLICWWLYQKSKEPGRRLEEKKLL